MVLNHQTRMTNLLTRLGWQSRIAAHDGAKAGGLPPQVRETAHELVDYMLFVDEAPLPSPVRGASAFTKEFPSKGPRDSKGRSLRDLDLTRRLLRYPCSYMIYTEAFDALPAAAKAVVYERLWAILSGNVTDGEYSKLRPAIAAPLSRFCGRRKRDCRRTSGQREDPERVGRNNRDVLLAVAALIGDGVRISPPLHFRHPQLSTVSRIERTKTIVVG